MREDNKNFITEGKAVEQQAEEKALTEPATTQEAAEKENEYILKFKKPFVWEDNTYTEIDISGLEDMSAKDMIQAQRIMERSGSINVLPEMSLEYACIFASKATKMPVEFFQALPPKEALKLKNRITNFFYGGD